MYKACYAKEMRAADKAATDECNIPSIVLMENAAIACLDELKKRIDIKNSRIGIFCGKGNNGGDGLALARHLYNAGAEVNLYLVCGTDFAGDAKINYDIAAAMGIPTETVTDTDNLEYVIRSCDAVVDAILGTGINGTVRDNVFDVIRLINENAKYILSVDVPSGIDSDSGEICGICVNADTTVTFAAYKIGMFLYPAADCMGEIVVAPISVPQNMDALQNIRINVTDSEFVKNTIPVRDNNSHKGNYGKLLVIAGSEGMSGAAYLASEAALKSGAGLITLMCPKCISAVLENKTTEVMTCAIDDCGGSVAESAEHTVLKRLAAADAVLIGPGLGRTAGAAAIVGAVLKNSNVPVVVDADAIFAVSEDMSVLRDCSCDLIFTPHTAEMSRLTGLDTAYIESNRIQVSREFSEDAGAVLLLKGHHTVVTAPNLEQYISSTGNPGMATGGSGDVLAGIAAALAARGIDAASAAACAVHIHGFAGDIAKEKYGEESMSAGDILRSLPEAFCRILQVDKQ